MGGGMGGGGMGGGGMGGGGMGGFMGGGPVDGLGGGIRNDNAGFGSFPFLSNNNPPGSWVCPSCGNLNYPHRTVCNDKNCGHPRPSGNENVGNVPQHRSATGNPPGSWVCPACQNVNWPHREVCNISTCGQAKPIDEQQL